MPYQTNQTHFAKATPAQKQKTKKKTKNNTKTKKKCEKGKKIEKKRLGIIRILVIIADNPKKHVQAMNNAYSPRF